MRALDRQPSPLSAGSRHDEATDAQLMRIGGGEHDALAQLYDRHATAASSLARRMLRNQAAEDVCQEAFLAIWRKADAFDAARGAVRTWLLGIVRNRAIDTIRYRSVPTRHLYVGGLTHREIAHTSKLPLGTVEGRLRLGLGKLRGQADLTVTP